MNIAGEIRSRSVFEYVADHWDCNSIILDPSNQFDIWDDEPHVIRDRATGRDVGFIYYCRKTNCVKHLIPKNPNKFSSIPDLNIEEYNRPLRLLDGRIIYWSGNKIRKRERLSSWVEIT